jgi:hypothetical protein
MRPPSCDSITVQVSATGSYSSAAVTGPSYLFAAPPPTTSIFPSGRVTALAWMRGKCIGAV